MRGWSITRRASIVLLCSALLAAGTTAPELPCRCEAARATNGWCDAHQVGYVGPVAIESKLLWEAQDAHGHDLDLRTFECGSCKRAIASDGFCEGHRIGFLGGQAYFSWLTFMLAKGETRSGPIACRVCRANAKDVGWCETCKFGMIGRVAIRDRRQFDRTSEAIRILRVANDAASRCESCALAIITDTQCPLCRIDYKDGKKVSAGAGAARSGAVVEH